MNNVDKVNLSDDLPSQTNNSTDHLTMSVSSLLNDIPLNTLSDFYDIETSLFKKRIDKLNLKFYWESEGLSSQKEIPKPYSKLFLILFKQINLFNEEIERLNLIIKEKNKNETYFKGRILEFSQKEKDRILTKQMLKNYQKQNKQLEKKLKERYTVEDKLKAEIEKLKEKIKNHRDISINISNSNNSLNYTFNRNQIKNYTAFNPKRNFHSFDTRNGDANTSITVNKKIYNKRNHYTSNGNYLNNSMILPTNKTYNNFPIEKTFENVIPNEDVINQCINHYSDELDNLDNIEAFLEKQKKDIQDAFTKGHFKNLKKTLKGVPHY